MKQSSSIKAKHLKLGQALENSFLPQKFLSLNSLVSSLKPQALRIPGVWFLVFIYWNLKAEKSPL